MPAISRLCQPFSPSNIHFIADAHDETAIEFNAFPVHCLRGTAESEIVAELQHFVVNPVIKKNSTNAFHPIIQQHLRLLILPSRMW